MSDFLTPLVSVLNIKTNHDSFFDTMAKNVIFTFGSGGHTTEMLSLLDNSRMGDKLRSCNARFIVSQDDQLAVNKLNQKFSIYSDNYDIIKLRRGRRVGQSYFTSLFTVLLSLFQAIAIIAKEKPRILVTNGPAISVILCLALKLMQISTLFLAYNCDVIYIESFCRTKTLSLSGKLIYHLRISNLFLVQWPELIKKYPRSEYHGLLV